MTGMLLMLSTIDYLRNKKSPYKFHIDEQAKYWNKGINAINYAKNIGFFTALGFDKGKKISWESYLNDNHNRNKNNFCPIFTISWDTLYEYRDYHNGIVACSKKLAKVLASDMGEEQEKTVSYLIREILRNPFEHSTAKKVWISAQKHPTDKYIEVVIADNAEGLKQTLSVNKNIKSSLKGDIDALRYSLKPGISGSDTTRKGTWSNSGYGLYVTSNISSKLGSFIIISGKCALECKKTEKIPHSTNYQGTAIVLNFNIDKIKNIDSSLITEIVDEGEKIAADTYGSSKVASKASKIVDFS